MWWNILEQHLIVYCCSVWFPPPIQMIDISQVPSTNLQRRIVILRLSSEESGPHLPENTPRVPAECLHIYNVVILVPAGVAQHPVGLPVPENRVTLTDNCKLPWESNIIINKDWWEIGIKLMIWRDFPADSFITPNTLYGNWSQCFYLLYVVGLFIAMKVKNLAKVGFFFPPFRFFTIMLQ